MSSQVSVSIEERIVQLLRHLGIKRAHVAASFPRDWAGLVTSYPEIVSSLSLISPWGFKISALRSHTSRLLIISGDQGRPAEEVRRAAQRLPGSTVKMLPDYFSSNWADIIADCTDLVGATLMNFIAQVEQSEKEDAVTLNARGEFADLSYTASGSGTPLVLFPLALAPSQWQPLIPALSKRHCTIVLSGAMVGAAAFLEARAPGYLRVVRSLMDELRLHAGEKVLEVGCGSGVILRWLAGYTGGANRLVGIDLNRYLLREAQDLAQKTGIDEILDLAEGNAESLPFPDNCFDVTIACTVLEEGNADRMLAECVRVTKPGGRVGALVRSIDMPGWVNLPLGAALKQKAEAQSGSAEEHGCADASLYQRLLKVGLRPLVIFPQWATYSDGERLDYMEERILASLTPEQAEEWRQARSRPESHGTFFIAQPFHCALGTKR